ncbi:hypothetical protein DAI22_10g123700 [Oryza sativa Japonica Group]|nr:hypothetical protein DAI22_10g123700 [Oryza sativa Japonica Group]
MAREREPRELVNLSAGGATVTGAHSPVPLVTPTRAATAQPRSPPPVMPSPQASQASPLLSEPLDWGTDAEEEDDDAIAPELHQRSAETFNPQTAKARKAASPSPASKAFHQEINARSQEEELDITAERGEGLSHPEVLLLSLKLNL